MRITSSDEDAGEGEGWVPAAVRNELGCPGEDKKEDDIVFLDTGSGSEEDLFCAGGLVSKAAFATAIASWRASMVRMKGANLSKGVL